jgi:hypothetical protein
MRLAHVLWRGCAAAACLALWLALTVAAAPARPADGWYAGKSTIQGSTHSPVTAAQIPGPPTWPAHPYVLATTAAAEPAKTSSPGFDWGAAAIGAGTALVFAGVLLAAVTGVRRARHSRARAAAG